MSRITFLLVLALLFALLAGCSAEEEEPIVSALHFFQRGNQAYADENFRGAIFNYKKALNYDDGIAEFHYNLGLSFYQVGAFDEAVAAYHRAIQIAGDDPLVHMNLALTYDRLYNLQAAHTHFNKYRALMVAGGAGTEEKEGASARPASLKAGDPRAKAPGKTPAQKSAERSGQPRQTLADNKAKSDGSQLKRPARQTAAQPAAPPAGDSRKWWIQDQFTPAR